MAKQSNRITDNHDARNGVGLDASLVIIPPENQPSNPELHRTVRLLMLADTLAERAIVGLCLYHRLPVRDAAERVGITPKCAEELIESLSTRVHIAEREDANARRMTGRNPAPSYARVKQSKGGRK